MTESERYDLSNDLCDQAVKAMEWASSALRDGIEHRGHLASAATMLRSARAMAPHPSRDLDRAERTFSRFDEDHRDAMARSLDIRRLDDARARCTGVALGLRAAKDVPSAEFAQIILGGLVYLLRDARDVMQEKDGSTTVMWLSGLAQRIDHMSEFSFSSRIDNSHRIEGDVASLHDWISKATIPHWLDPDSERPSNAAQTWRTICMLVASRCDREPVYGIPAAIGGSGR